jgi:hypothetical protein
MVRRVVSRWEVEERSLVDVSGTEGNGRCYKNGGRKRNVPVQVGDVGICLGEIGWKGGFDGLNVGRCRLRRGSHDRAARDLELSERTGEIYKARLACE